MFLPLSELRSVRVNRWNRETPASWSSALCLSPGCLLQRFRRKSPEILQHKAGDLLPYTGPSRGADTFEDQPEVVGSQLKRSSGESQPQKVGSQPERL